MQLKQALVIAVYAGELLLRHGADISRVEETISRITRAYGFEFVETFVTPTGIIVSADNRNSPLGATYLKRVRQRSWNLRIISQVNAFSRAVAQEPPPYNEAMQRLRQIEKGPDYYPQWLVILGGAVGSAALTILFGASKAELLPAFLTALVVLVGLELFAPYPVPVALINFGAGLAASLTAILLQLLGWPFDLSLAIIGGLIPMVPGMIFTGMVSDAIAGDLVSAAARGLEAALIAVSLAAGVAISLYLYLSLGGAL